MKNPAPYIPQIRLYQQWLEQRHGLKFDDYEALWRWSVDEQEAFWMSLWEHDAIDSPVPPTTALANDAMPGAQWFPGTQVNYTQRVLRHAEAAHRAGQPAIISDNELGEARELSWPELQRQVASFAITLRELGVGRGDRVAAYLPNVPETIVAFLACASLGAIWSVCAPDMGTQAVTDRFQQITPRVLIAADGVYYAGKSIDRADTVTALKASLPTVEKIIVLQSAHSRGVQSGIDLTFAQAIARDDDEVRSFQPDWLPFDHPLWVVYSSGTTGLPKPLVHGHGGIITIVAAIGKHNDIGASYAANSFGRHRNAQLIA